MARRGVARGIHPGQVEAGTATGRGVGGHRKIEITRRGGVNVQDDARVAGPRGVIIKAVIRNAAAGHVRRQGNGARYARFDKLDKRRGMLGRQRLEMSRG